MVAHTKKGNLNHGLCRRCGNRSLNKKNCVSCGFKKTAKLNKRLKVRKNT